MTVVLIHFRLRDQTSTVRFPALPDILRSSRSGKGSTQPREDNWRAAWIKSSGSDLENLDSRSLGSVALRSLTSGGRPVGMCFFSIFLLTVPKIRGVCYLHARHSGFSSCRLLAKLQTSRLSLSLSQGDSQVERELCFIWSMTIASALLSACAGCRHG
jgi:hypothetical protein